MEYRIYYEALEQGVHLIQKTILEVNPKAKIKLVKKRQQSYTNNGFRAEYSKLLSKILIRKNPDIIISVIIDKVEYPLIVLEFSTAVYTKDHEQQRADNYLLPIHNNVIYIKLSPTKKSSKQHGGDTKYDYLEPYALCLQKYNELSYHFEWEVAKNDNSKVLKDTKYKSIAPEYKGLKELFSIIFNINFQNEISKWKKSLNSLIEKTKVLKEWKNKLIEYNDFEDIKNINSTRTNWEDYNPVIDKNNVFTLKINRMGHAMDPERGMLIYYSSFFREGNTIVSKMVFSPETNTWYKDTSSEKIIKAYIDKKKRYNKKDLIFLLANGLNISNKNILIELVEKNIDRKIIDITEFVDKYYLLFNTSFRTIIDHSDFLIIDDSHGNELILSWNNSNFRYNLKELKDISIIKKREEISEDDVTYITVHNVFKENKIKVISVSYPGAQSDMPILPNKTAGRKQERIYIDVIGKKANNLILQENKGKFTTTTIGKDIDKIALFKTNKKYKEAVVTFVKENSLKTDKTIIGVGFGESIRMDLSKVNLNKVDYFLIISKDLKSWKLYSNLNKNDDIFNIKSGKIQLPSTFEVIDRQKGNKINGT